MVKPGKKQKVVEEEEEVEEEVEITQADFNEIGKLVVQGATLTKIKVAFPKIPPAVLKEAVEAFKQKGKKKAVERNAPLPNPKPIPEANFERQVPGNIFSFFSLSSQTESFPLLVPVFIPLQNATLQPVVHELESSPMVPYSFTHGEKLFMLWRKTPGMKVDFYIEALSFTTVIEVDVPTQTERATLIPQGTPTPRFTPLGDEVCLSLS